MSDPARPRQPSPARRATTGLPQGGRRPWPCVAAVLAALLAPACAHEWNSPTSRPALRPWPGLLWAGPASGPPPAPAAPDCRRAPQAFELGGPQDRPEGQAGSRRDRVGADGAELAESGSAREAAAKALGAPAAPRLGRDEVHAGTRPAARAPAAAEQAHDALMHEQDHRRGAAAAVSAGMVDDNAGFADFMAFQRRHARLAPGAPDVGERYRLIVHDAAGQPVPDAQVVVRGASGGALWARTDAGGEVWLHPRAAGLGDAWLDVEVRLGGAGAAALQANALLRRGQRDALQLTLDARAPVTPARLDLVFLVDATGSMADEIDKLRQSMQAIADQIAALPSRPQTCFALVAYRDQGDAFFVRGHDFTDDLQAFQRELDGLQADGGGDYAEALDEALHTAVHRLSWRDRGATRLLLLVGDAPPHLPRRGVQPSHMLDMQAALARGIKLMTLGASGLDRQGELVYRRLAQYTGGRFVFLTYADAARPSSGPGRETAHEVRGYSVHTLDKLIVRLVREELARRPQ